MFGAKVHNINNETNSCYYFFSCGRDFFFQVGEKNISGNPEICLSFNPKGVGMG